MNILLIILLTVTFSILTGCTANLVPHAPSVDFANHTASIEVKNIGAKTSEPQLTYVEINEVGAANNLKPQSQYSASVPAIAAGGSWNSGPIPFSSFSSPRGLDLFSLTSANLVVAVDAKDMVEESDENDNLYDANH